MEMLIQIGLVAVLTLLVMLLTHLMKKKDGDAQFLEIAIAHQERLKSLHPHQYEAHQHSSRHKSEVMASDWCGCFYCLSTFRPSEINQWVDDNDTALCPKCKVDAVIGTASGYPVTNDFLKEMQVVWFN